MNLSKQIKKYRDREGFSQEDLAEKIYVSRQTISNWENERSYPDIHNLLFLSVLFDVSLDDLVKGDMEMMKNNLQQVKFNKLGQVMAIFLILAVGSIGLAIKYFGNVGLIIPFVFWVIAMTAAIKIDIIKKRENIKTYAEIVAFMENKDVNAERDKRDKKKYIIQKTLIVVGVALVSGIIALLSFSIFL
ncbi:helix-turn-helix transcriptional regulator [Bacillus thuringiensis]|uniref:helix-turn-helix transcriptional regulator n=1 Tax=Bacillus thuringiensis TaxID=1428 RepID=UPI001298D734|nr:helix-turn-helix transcriptional regulator [Bacillus thuringiensis]MRC32269.1 helix-turn-helix domain-containing protein [Bacillus thuringiensis]HDR8043328.1 helix-turn-helix transcriptional regulator [Bacillus cereus]